MLYIIPVYYFFPINFEPVSLYLKLRIRLDGGKKSKSQFDGFAEKGVTLPRLLEELAEEAQQILI